MCRCSIWLAKNLRFREGTPIPELPEIECVVRDLRPLVSGRMITSLMLRPSGCSRILHYPPQKLHEVLLLATVQTVLRRGKYIIMPLSNNNVLVLHLGMTGRILISEIPEVPFDDRYTGDTFIDKHTHFLMELMDEGDEQKSDLEFRFHDPRMFGNIWLIEQPENIENLDVPGLRDLGPDALTVDLEKFRSIFSRSKRSIKSFLLDQTKIAGVGNIYADEACFAAKLHPTTSVSSLETEQKAKLWLSIKSVLKEGIKYRGSSTSDYTGIDGEAGSYQKLHKVYGKFGFPCVECGTKISRIKLNGRSTHFCPICQPLLKVGEGVIV